MKKIFILTLFIVFSYASLQAQPIKGSTYETMILLAEEALANQDYVNALEQYELAYDDRKDSDLVPILAEINYKIRDYRSSERMYRNLLRRDKENVYVEHRFNYARVLKMQGKYDEAVEEFQTFLSLSKDEAKKEMAQMELAGAELGMAGGSTQGVSIESIGNKKIALKVSQYSPTLSSTGRTFYYGSGSGKGFAVMDDPDDPEKFVRIFSSMIDEEGKYEDPAALGPEINRPGYHSANVSLSSDGRRMYFNRAVLETGNLVTEAKIYMSEGGDGGWKSANEVVGINGDYLALQPVVGDLYGKEVLFFVSDMEGGEGGLDIYYATYQGEGVYSDPVNLGPGINTAGDEYTPFWYDGTLYFSSEGYPSLGGFDIMYATWNGTEWSAPLNMGSAYNSAADDYYFRLYDEGYKGYFTSNREGGPWAHAKGCCDNIYTFTIARQFVDLVVGTFSNDEGVKEPLKGATVQLVDNGAASVTEATTSLTMANSNVFSYALSFEHSYSVIASHPDYFSDTVTFNTNGVVDSKTFEERIFLAPKPPVRLFDTLFINEPFVMENIVYDFDQDKITEQAEIDLEVIYGLMVDNPDMKIELGSHTDNQGNDDYNKGLSQRRAESARRWLMRKGVERARINVQGYGETVPRVVTVNIAKNFPFLKEGDILTEAFINTLENKEQIDEAHHQNRRTEFTIIEGPTSIQKRIIKEVTEDENDRGSNIGAPQRTQHDPIEVSKMSSLFGQTNLKGLPIMQFETRTHTVGKVNKGDKRSFSYTFTNKGDGNLVIDLISACDCTTTNQDELVGKTFKPGDSATITVIFDSADKDESETIDIDIYLRNSDNEGNPIMEMIKYDFEL